MHPICLLFLLLLSPTERGAQDSSTTEKTQVILQLQDGRRGDDPRLAKALLDGNATIREQAALACASIQDTSLLQELLNRLHDENTGVREAASFAIGQTGSFLSVQGKELLERECLDRISEANSPQRLMEEIGKFGSSTALSRLVELGSARHSAAERNALVMGIARFAIRGVSTEVAVHFLDSLIGDPSTVSWQTVYALQRSPTQPRAIVPLVIPLLRHKDPLVRMNAATLLGKLGDTLGSSSALVRLSADDPDWRVRVNATKAMAMPGIAAPPIVVDRMVNAFSDPNEHVALTALSSFGDMLKGRGRLTPTAQRRLWKFSENANKQFSIRRQAESFSVLAKIMLSKVFSRLSRIHPTTDWLTARHLAALGLTGEPQALALLLRAAKQHNPMVASSALEGLQHVGEAHPTNRKVVETVVESAIQALNSSDVSVLSASASILEDSVFQSADAVSPLIRSLERLHEPDDIEAMQQIIQTLGSLRDKRAVDPLIRQLRSSDRTVAQAAAAALEKLTGQPYSQQVHVAFTSESAHLHSWQPLQIPDTVIMHMKTSAGLVVLELYPRHAPYTVASFLHLCGRRFFDGIRFHRVVPNFVVQGGDPRGDGWGGPGYSLRSEFSLLRYDRGMLGIASAGKDTEGSQFFITHSPQPHLDGRYTIFGKVRSGMEIVDQLQVGDTILHITTATGKTTSK